MTLNSYQMAANHNLPEFDLWLAVIKQAKRDLEDDSPFAESRRRWARGWFVSNDDRMGAFVWICDVFNVDPGRVRTRVMEVAAC